VVRGVEAHARHGLVASPHPLASEAGLSILRAGGSALDAAIAAAVTIAVVYPHMNGVGGDNVWLIYDGERGHLLALNAAGRSAGAASLETYRSRYGAAIPTRGGAAALTVPGAVSGWWEAHRHSRERLGSRIDWKRLFADAITHAREGFTPSPGQRRVTAAAADLFVNDSPHEVKTTLWPIYHPDRLEGGRFVQHDLARTLEAIATDGPEEFYRGALARRIANAAAGVGSPLTFDDFATHGADWGDPIRVPYRGGEVVSLSPPTQGFAALAILALVEGFDVAALDDADYVHVLVEATKLAFEDRDRYLSSRWSRASTSRPSTTPTTSTCSLRQRSSPSRTETAT